KHKKGLGNKWLEHPPIVDARPDTHDSYFVHHANDFAKKHKIPIKFHGVHHNNDEDQMHWKVSKRLANKKIKGYGSKISGTNEEVDQLDELSKETLASYIVKATKSSSKIKEKANELRQAADN